MSEIVKRVCRCGVESRAYQRTGNLGEIAEKSGFGFIWDVGNGLTALWLCPSCFKRVADAWRTIVETAGTETLGMTGLLKQVVPLQAEPCHPGS